MNETFFDRIKKGPFYKMLIRINFPAHDATFREAMKGWPTREYAMDKEEALHVARGAMFFAILRAWEKMKA